MSANLKVKSSSKLNVWNKIFSLCSQEFRLTHLPGLFEMHSQHFSGFNSNFCFPINVVEQERQNNAALLSENRGTDAVGIVCKTAAQSGNMRHIRNNSICL